jgi:hypothetical protein
MPASAEDSAEKAKAVFESAKKMLAETGDCEAAMHKVVEAASLDPTQKDYSTHLLWIGRTQRLQALKAREKDEEKWCQWSRSLNMFYMALGMKQQAIENAKELFARSKLPKDAIRLAKAYYHAEEFENAAALLRSLGDERTPDTDAMLVLAMKQAGDAEGAIALARELECPERLDAGTAYTMARVKAIAGDAETSAAILKALFVATAPSRLEGRKQNVVDCADFDPIRDTDLYKEAMETESELSGCSEGKSCATCPMRTQCQQGGTESQTEGTEMDPTK